MDKHRSFVKKKKKISKRPTYKLKPRSENIIYSKKTKNHNVLISLTSRTFVCNKIPIFMEIV